MRWKVWRWKYERRKTWSRGESHVVDKEYGDHCGDTLANMDTGSNLCRSIADINKSCLEEFRKHWTCLEDNNQQLWQCRPAEWKLNRCVFENLVSDVQYHFIHPQHHKMVSVHDSSKIFRALSIILTTYHHLSHLLTTCSSRIPLCDNLPSLFTP